MSAAVGRLSPEDKAALLNGVVICGLSAIHNPNCGHVVGNKFIRSPREGDRLAGCCHRLSAVVEPPAIAALIEEAVAAALTEVADRWQCGEWANAPRCADRVQERIANAQYVTDWLRSAAAKHTDP